MSRPPLNFLRPYLYQGVRSLKPEHLRAYLSVQRRFAQSVADAHTGPHDVEKTKRLEQLRNVKPLAEYHPRAASTPGVPSLSPQEFNTKYNDVVKTDAQVVSVMGRVRSVRTAGSKLMFLDIEREGHELQAMVDLKKLNACDNLEIDFKRFKKVARLGDWISITGRATRTTSDQLSILAQEVPQVVAPCLHHVPEKIEDPETLARRPHIHQLTNRQPADILRLRAMIYDYMRTVFISKGFLEVETPMFDVKAGGAMARPFETVANEMSNTPLKLRIAPELNLKRLIVGGQDKIFEIGRSFRNEGVDNTHNPEFTTCEFYEVNATLPQLIQRTEDLIHGLHTTIETARPTSFSSLSPPSDIDFSTPFAQLPFIPTIEQQTGHKLPDLCSPTALEDLINLFASISLPLPPHPTLPRLLDSLAESYIEPLCKNPTFITHHPEALSPLSKSFICPTTGQRIAARVELFIQSREYVNAYEEENSPFEQRRKFVAQALLNGEREAATAGGAAGDADVEVEVDESYLEVLEWGMPPTGGWGAGLDRLVMLFADQKRIADVLPFGTLRNVVSIAKNK